MTLKQYMTTHGISQVEMARMLGVRQPTIHRYREGLQVPGARVMQRLIDVTRGEVAPNDFFRMPRPRKGNKP
jgi:transcriptional regulator with XRE-family HTH domain